MKRQSLILVGLAACLSVLAAPGCSPEQLQGIDRAVADANAIGQGIAALPEGPAGALIPPAVRIIIELLGISAALAAAVWQRIRASKIVEEKAGLDKTLRVIADAIDRSEPAVAGPIKVKVKELMKARGVFDLANRVVDEHRSVTLAGKRNGEIV